MIDHLHKPNYRSHVSIVVAFVRAEMLRLLGARNRRQKRHALEDRLNLRLVMAVCGDSKPDGHSGHFGKKMPFGAAFAAIGGIRNSGLAAERRFGYAPVEGLPLKIEADVGVVLEQAGRPKLLEEAALAPRLKAVVDRGRGAELARQGVPLTSGA